MFLWICISHFDPLIPLYPYGVRIRNPSRWSASRMLNDLKPSSTMRTVHCLNTDVLLAEMKSHKTELFFNIAAKSPQNTHSGCDRRDGRC